MAGAKVPLVFYSRYTTAVAKTGGGSFYTSPIDMFGFEEFYATFWRGEFVSGGTPTLEFEFEQSADLTQWEKLTGTVDPIAPIEDEPLTITRVPTQRYVRCVAIAGDEVRVTFWGIGIGVRTES